MKKAFITGISGFIGSHVAEAFLNDGWEVMGLLPYGGENISHILNQIKVLEADLGQAPKIERELISYKPDICVHMAWYTNPKDYANSDVNIECLKGSLDLFNAIGKTECKHLMVAGTCFEYNTALENLTEASPCVPQSLYAASKYSLYLLAEQICKRNNWQFQYPRIFYTYGPRSPMGKFPNNVINSLLDDKPWEITSACYMRDYVYVTDIADAFLAVANSRANGVINVGTGSAVPMFQILECIAKQLDKKHLLNLSQFLNYDYTQPPGIRNSSQTLRREFGWEPKISLAEGISRTIWWVGQERKKLQEALVEQRLCQVGNSR